MDGSKPHRPRRSGLRALLLLGSVALGALVVARLSPPRPGRAAPPGRPEESAPGADEPAAAEPGGSGAAVQEEAPDWQRVAKEPDGARAHTAAELTAALVAEFAKDDPRALNLANIGALRKLLGGKSEAEILEAAAALLECGTLRASQAASTLALGVLGGESRRITDDEAYAIVGEAAARALTESGATPGDVYATQMMMLAGRILAAIGSPRATEVLLDCASGFGSPTTELVASIRNPASVPLLLQAISRTDVDHGMIASALCKSGDGRAELRRLLDPAGGFDWAGHGGAKAAALRALATGFREDKDLSAIDAALRVRPDVVDVVTGAMAQHGKAHPMSDAALAVPTKTEQARAVVGFLAGHAGSALEDSLIAMLGRFPERIVDPLLPRLGAGTRERVVAARGPAK